MFTMQLATRELQVWAIVPFPAAELSDLAMFHSYTDRLQHLEIDCLVWLFAFREQ